MTEIRTELSTNSKYHLSKHRYLELKHFCLQYPEWKAQYNAIFSGSSCVAIAKNPRVEFSDKVFSEAARKLDLRTRMELVETTAKIAEPEIDPYLFIAVTEDLAFPKLKARYAVPFGKDLYYDRYRRFFWLLDARQKSLLL